MRKSKYDEIINKKFNRLLVLSYSYTDNYRSRYFDCKCDCGNLTIVKGYNLVKGITKSCGCLQKEVISKIAKRINTKKRIIKVENFTFSNKDIIIKEDYDLTMINYIYKITNLVNNKIYIGKSERPLKITIQRYRTHYKSNNRNIYKAFKKYGNGNFLFEIILKSIPILYLDILEQFYISYYKSNNKNFGYNLTLGGEGTKGFKWSKESKKSLSKNMKDKYKGKNNPFYGKHHTEETKKKIIESNKRRKGLKIKPCSEERRERIRQAKLKNSIKS